MQAYPIRREDGPITQMGLASYEALELLTLGCARSKDMLKLSYIAMNCPDEVNMLKQAQGTPDIGDSLSLYVVHDKAPASACVQETLDCWDGNSLCPKIEVRNTCRVRV
jgi:hypothetical protein